MIILNGTNFPYYLQWVPGSPHLFTWTTIKESAYLYASEKKAQDDIDEFEIDAYVKTLTVRDD